MDELDAFKRILTFNINFLTKFFQKDKFDLKTFIKHFSMEKCFMKEKEIFYNIWPIS